MTHHTPLTNQQLADIDTAIAAYRQHAPTGFACCTAHPAADAGAALLAEVHRLRDELEQHTEALASADNPTQLRWGLNDVLWGDDDTVTVLMSGPDREPYWLELDPERAAVLREDLAGPDGDEADTLPAWLYQRFAVIHGMPAWDRIDDAERAYWEHQARAVRRAVARNGFKVAVEETHVVADDSDDPEHVDDCPGCVPAAVVGGESGTTR